MAVSISEALNIIAEKVSPVDSEILPIEDSLGRVVVQNYISLFNLPRFNNSAMDGYAVKVSDATKSVACTQIIYAGDDSKMVLKQNNAIKIMTGAPIPEGTEAIVPIENVNVSNNTVTLPTSIQNNAFIRMAGEDIKKGTIFLTKGSMINAYHIASLASQGITHITVARKIRVAIFATGDELRPHFEKIKPYQLYNSNSLMFLARSRDLGCVARLVHTSADTIQSLETSIKSALDADIIITSGGVSVGDKDFTKEAFINLGMELYIDRIDIKPGKPTVIGSIGNTIVVNLPGNPLASMVNFELFTRAIIRKMSGRSDYYHSSIETVMEDDFPIKGGKHAVILGKFNGQSFEALKPQMPGMVSPMQKANSFILIHPEKTLFQKNSLVKMIPISWEFCSNKKEDLFTN